MGVAINTKRKTINQVKKTKTIVQGGKTNSNEKKNYVQNYRKAWEAEVNYKDWISPDIKSQSTKAFCKWCNVSIRAHKKSLDDHAATDKHKNNADLHHSSVPKITKFVKPKISEQRKIAELKLATFVANYCSMNAATQLAKVVGSLDSKSEILQNLTLGKTKCTGLIVNVLAPCSLRELIEDLGDAYFSLIIDESTSVDTKKLLCIMVRYFSKSKGKIITTLYRLVEIHAGTAAAVTSAIEELLEKDGLKLDRLIGIGVDGANVMVGKNNSVSSRLKEKVPHLITAKCVCHSLHLSCEKAAEQLPDHLDYFVHSTYNYFSNSTKRKDAYEDIWKTMEGGKKPKKIPQLSATRWLTRENATEVILDQWDALKLFFQISGEKEKDFAAKQLHSMYQSESNKVFLIFLRDALKSAVGMNKLFQSEAVDALKLFEDLNELLYSSLQKIVIPQQLEKANKKNLTEFDFRNHLMSSESIYFGYEFAEASKNFTKEKLYAIKSQCKSFLIEFCVQLQQRIPDNIDLLEKVSVFTPRLSVHEKKRDITDIVIHFKTVVGDVDATLREWHCVNSKILAEKNQSTEDYWNKIDDMTTAGGEKRYGHISKLVLALMALPLSNATVERAFSLINIIKDKLRNRMAIDSCEAVIRVRYNLKQSAEFQPSKIMLEYFRSEEVYASKFKGEILKIVSDGSKQVSVLDEVEEEEDEDDEGNSV